MATSGMTCTYSQMRPPSRLVRRMMTAAAFRMAGARASRYDAEVNGAVAGLLRRPRPIGLRGDARSVQLASPTSSTNKT